MNDAVKPNKTIMTEPDFALKKKIGPDVNMRDVFTKDKINACQEMINEVQEDFFNFAASDLAAIEEAYNVLKENPNEESQLHTLIDKSYILKGQSESLGFELVSHVAFSLHTFCEKQYTASNQSLLVIQKHVETLKVAFHQKLRGQGGQIGSELLKSMQKLIDKFSA